MRLSKYFTLLLAILLISTQAFAQKEKVSMRDTADGAFDASNFLLSVTGFLPVPVVITEPAIGYGGGLFGAYFHKKESVENTINRPDISIGGGGLTENGTWFAGGGHLGFWNEDRIRYRGFLLYANPFLNFYFGRDLEIETEIGTEMQMLLLLQNIHFRLGTSNWFLGGEYMYYSTDVKFQNVNNPAIDLILSRIEQTLVNSGVGMHLLFDGRDNIYTTNKGWYWESTLRYFPEFLGTSQQYGSATTDLKWFTPIVKNNIYLALKNTASLVFDDAPFYTLPFVQMRGVKAMRYQGEFVNTLQAEGRFKVYKRWSLVGFGGIGFISPTLSDFEVTESVWAGGTGFRYMMARLFNLQAGMDFAWSQKDPLTGENQFAFYLTFGTAL